MTGVVFWAVLAAVAVALVAVVVIEFRQWRFERRYPTTLDVAASPLRFPGAYPFHVAINPGTDQQEIVTVRGRDRSGAWRIERGVKP